MKDIYNYTIDSLEQYFTAIGEEKFRAVQIFEWLYKQLATDFLSMDNLKKELRGHLQNEFIIPKFKIVEQQESSDGTVKFLFELNDGALIETVLMRQYYGNSVCISTQVGCNMGCAFCASGTTKRMRNLTTGELVNQIIEVERFLQAQGENVTHIVVMGIGEPFDNFDNLVSFLSIINFNRGLDIGARHITVSTCGIVPKIYEFSELPWQVNLAISLHFPNNELRSKYMLVNRKYSLDKLMPAIKYYVEKTNRRVTFEYILLDNINDTQRHAEELAELVKGINGVINLIPYNETATQGLARSSEHKRAAFFNHLKKHNLNVTTRKELGHDIDAACGQLRVKKIKEV